MSTKSDGPKTVAKIIDVASRLFAEKGYEHTAVHDIADEMGMSKGAIFHHFATKEDIVEAVIDEHRKRLISAAETVANDKSIPVSERLVRTAATLQVKDDAGLQMVEHLHKPQNELLHARLERVLLSDATPILAEIVREGVQQGVFDTPYPEEAVEAILSYSNSAFDANRIVLFNTHALREKAKSFIWMMERLLGAKEGSLHGIKRMFRGL
ncbi:MAG: TetR/AcrR family transcriptional regulator [Bifidobacteriaceae bacterium]|jgi:AcrR family transcriptional regulator|nr:TetR/AcrR family transcriptional regulator [Bifidobacteriaceae bacterium]